MNSVICTLFEGHYHKGVAALVNSLYKNGFRGHIYAGYKGHLPEWAGNSESNSTLGSMNAVTLDVSNEVKIHFLFLDTDYHLTNYKPDFLLQLLAGPAKDCEAIFYFDPDIVVSAPWSYYEEWSNCGIALCEDVNSPLQEHHPRRIAWRTIFGTNGFELKFRNSIYVNGGFIGLTKSSFSFLSVWKNLQEIMASKIGGLSRSSLNGSPLPDTAKSPYFAFSKTDQDALNSAVEAWEGPVSFIGKEGMAFQAGAHVMLHALGQPKPWQWKPLTQALSGCSPRLVDKKYWEVLNNPIITHSSGVIKYRKISFALAALIGRFYRKGRN